MKIVFPPWWDKWKRFWGFIISVLVTDFGVLIVTGKFAPLWLAFLYIGAQFGLWMWWQDQDMRAKKEAKQDGSDEGQEKDNDDDTSPDGPKAA